MGRALQEVARKGRQEMKKKSAKTEETWMDGITTEMMEHICDDLCRHPDHLSGEVLEDKCAECKMGRFVCDILNQYNKVNDFANSQCEKLMCEMHELKERDTAKKPNIMDYILGDINFKCPTCKSEYICEKENEPLYCQNCGQRLDWSE